jgi:hypothetical protein
VIEQALGKEAGADSEKNNYLSYWEHHASGSAYKAEKCTYENHNETTAGYHDYGVK